MTRRIVYSTALVAFLAGQSALSIRLDSLNDLELTNAQQPVP